MKSDTLPSAIERTKETEMQITENIVLPKCQKCGAEDSMEHHKVRVPDVPLDADWDECVVCGYQTDPE